MLMTMTMTMTMTKENLHSQCVRLQIRGSGMDGRGSLLHLISSLILIISDFHPSQVLSLSSPISIKVQHVSSFSCLVLIISDFHKSTTCVWFTFLPHFPSRAQFREDPLETFFCRKRSILKSNPFRNILGLFSVSIKIGDPFRELQNVTDPADTSV